MIAADLKTRNSRAGEHLQLMRALARELERAMRAISGNDLVELEDSVAIQQTLSAELGELADFLRDSVLEQRPVTVDTIDAGLMREIRSASEELQRLNLSYSILLKYSSRSVALMAALFNSFRGQLQEASGPRLKHQTWSCRM
jgi:hypothetical protein